MDNAPTSDRASYLEKWFPDPVSSEHHAPGRFAEHVFDLLTAASPIQVELRRTRIRYVAIDGLDLGGTPTHEEVHIRFRLVAEPRDVPDPENIRWGGLDEPIKGSLEPVFYYSFSADVAPEQTLGELRSFIAEHLGDELGPTPTAEASIPNSPRRTSMTAVRVFALIVFYAGLVILLAFVLIEAILRQTYGLALGVVALALILAGQGIALWFRGRWPVPTGPTLPLNGRASRFEVPPTFEQPPASSRS